MAATWFPSLLLTQLKAPWPPVPITKGMFMERANESTGGVREERTNAFLLWINKDWKSNKKKNPCYETCLLSITAARCMLPCEHAHMHRSRGPVSAEAASHVHTPSARRPSPARFITAVWTHLCSFLQSSRTRRLCFNYQFGRKDQWEERNDPSGQSSVVDRIIQFIKLWWFCFIITFQHLDVSRYLHIHAKTFL